MLQFVTLYQPLDVFPGSFPVYYLPVILLPVKFSFNLLHHRHKSLTHHVVQACTKNQSASPETLICSFRGFLILTQHSLFLAFLSLLHSICFVTKSNPSPNIYHNSKLQCSCLLDVSTQGLETK